MSTLMLQPHPDCRPPPAPPPARCLGLHTDADLGVEEVELAAEVQGEQLELAADEAAERVLAIHARCVLLGIMCSTMSWNSSQEEGEDVSAMLVKAVFVFFAIAFHSFFKFASSSSRAPINIATRIPAAPAAIDSEALSVTTAEAANSTMKST
eukprot:CAMPEP_0196720168 /NCGR_PEP_ID=MMETSP1091-20130531/3005_1 /TAXON_ID=302021 /ORGANISM="Rhodomonas sp., Strain CCMP768" /LENGTH=152 /DNA_ID=CAMNT_0042061311 /DNA_START=32 /DNA_END=487 /DNA_ORIENTATION=+